MAYKHPFVPLQNGSTSIGESLLLGPILPSRTLRLQQAQHRARGNLPASHLYLLCQPFSQPTKGCGHSLAWPGARGWIKKGWQLPGPLPHCLATSGKCVSSLRFIFPGSETEALDQVPSSQTSSRVESTKTKDSPDYSDAIRPACAFIRRPK